MLRELLSTLAFVATLLGVACAAEIKATPSSATCDKDADCHLESDYCTACDCRALGPGEKVPKCSGPGVRCMIDPCRGKVAKCVEHKCTST